MTRMINVLSCIAGIVALTALFAICAVSAVLRILQAIDYWNASEFKHAFGATVAAALTFSVGLGIVVSICAANSIVNWICNLPDEGRAAADRSGGLRSEWVLVLAAIGEGDVSGDELRETLSKQGVRMHGPGFYQLMAQIEKEGLVAGWYQTKKVSYYTLKKRFYRATSRGRKALEAWGREDTRGRPAAE